MKLILWLLRRMPRRCIYYRVAHPRGLRVRETGDYSLVVEGKPRTPGVYRGRLEFLVR